MEVRRSQRWRTRMEDKPEHRRSYQQRVLKQSQRAPQKISRTNTQHHGMKTLHRVDCITQPASGTNLPNSQKFTDVRLQVAVRMTTRSQPDAGEVTALKTNKPTNTTGEGPVPVVTPAVVANPRIPTGNVVKKETGPIRRMR